MSPFRWAQALFWSSLLALSAQAQEPEQTPDPASAPEPVPLTLDDFLAAFSLRDAELQVANWGTQRASLARQVADSPEQLDLYASPRLGGAALSPGLGTVAGEVGAGVAGLSWHSPTGATAGVEGHGSLYAPGASSLLASEAGINAWWAMPLGRNSQGRLNTLAIQSATQNEAAAQQLQEAARVERCWAATGGYLQAWNLEQQVAVYDEFLQRKESARKATARDVARGMLHRLELLTAESELAATRSRRQALQVQADQARAVLATWQDPADQARPLSDPSESLSQVLTQLDSEAARPLSDHPAALAFTSQAGARRLDAEWLREDWRTTIDLVPYAGASTLTGIQAGLALSVTYNAIAPRAEPQIAGILAEASLLDARQAAVLRDLAELEARALVAHEGALAQLALNEERLATIQKQVRSAWGQYQDGRIELQDYLQHYALYEQARLESLQLALARDLAVLSLASLHLDAPEGCQ